MRVLSVYMYICFSCCMISGCSSKDHRDFVEEYKSEDFSAFTKYKYVIRSARENDIRILGMTNWYNNIRDVGVGCYFFRNETDIDSINYFVNDAVLSKIDVPKMEELAKRFKSFNIGMLEVDSLGNVLVGTYSQEYPQLIKIVSDSNDILKTKYNLKLLDASWFEVQNGKH